MGYVRQRLQAAGIIQAACGKGGGQRLAKIDVAAEEVAVEKAGGDGVPDQGEGPFLGGEGRGGRLAPGFAEELEGGNRQALREADGWLALRRDFELGEVGQGHDTLLCQLQRKNVVGHAAPAG